MDDEFLHRLRKPPSRAFASELKRRLDRVAAERAPRRAADLLRAWFGVLTIGGAVAAIAVALVVAFDASQYLKVDTGSARAPLTVRDVAGDSGAGASGAAEKGDAAQHAKPAGEEPRGSGAAPGTGESRDGDSTAATGPEEPESIDDSKGLAGEFGFEAPFDRGSAVPAPPPARDAPDQVRGLTTIGGAATGEGQRDPRGGTLAAERWAAGSAAAVMYLRAVLERDIRVAIAPPGELFGTPLASVNELWCARPVDLVVTFERMPAAAAAAMLCRDAFLEIDAGREAVVFAAGAEGGRFDLSRDLVARALAAQVPLDSRSGARAQNEDGAAPAPMSNPYRTWADVAVGAPGVLINVLGPPTTSPLGRSLIEHTIGRLCPPDTAGRGDAQVPGCERIRGDGAFTFYREGEALVTALKQQPVEALAIVSFPFFAARDDLVALPVEGVVPTHASVLSGDYPLSRTLYVYVRNRPDVIAQHVEVVDALISTPLLIRDAAAGSRVIEQWEQTVNRTFRRVQ